MVRAGRTNRKGQRGDADALLDQRPGIVGARLAMDRAMVGFAEVHRTRLLDEALAYIFRSFQRLRLRFCERAHHLPQPCRLIVRRSEEHTSELQSLMRISYAVFCLKKKKTQAKRSKRYHIEQTH